MRPELLVVLISISALMAAVGFLAMIGGLIRTSLRYRNTEWIRVPATVVFSSILKAPNGNMGLIYTPVVRYEYVYQSVTYQSAVLSPDLHFASSRSEGDVKKWTSLFPVDSKVDAYISKSDPAIAVLFPCDTHGFFYALVVAFAVFGFCNALFFLFLLLR